MLSEKLREEFAKINISLGIDDDDDDDNVIDNKSSVVISSESMNCIRELYYWITLGNKTPTNEDAEKHFKGLVASGTIPEYNPKEIIKYVIKYISESYDTICNNNIRLNYELSFLKQQQITMSQQAQGLFTTISENQMLEHSNECLKKENDILKTKISNALKYIEEDPTQDLDVVKGLLNGSLIMKS